jgi:hypothetical protein
MFFVGKAHRSRPASRDFIGALIPNLWMQHSKTSSNPVEWLENVTIF